MSAVYDAVAFDIDGTLYPNRRFYRRLIPFAACHAPHLAAFARARKRIRDAAGAPPQAEDGGFYGLQARIMAEILRADVEKTRRKTEELIYRRWPAHFKKVRLFPHVKETLEAFRARGIKTAALSDFPIGDKLSFLGLGGLWDAALCSEEAGMLKPHTVSFTRLAGSLGVEPGRVLFVGNSLRCDVGGAKAAGMRAALVSLGPWTAWKALRPGVPRPDFLFSDYRKLRSFVLG